jgi:site-specific DNA-cytosine methylase
LSLLLPSSSGTPREPTATPPTPSSPTPSGPKASTPARTEQDEERPSFLSENQRAEVLETPYARQLTQGGRKPGQGYPAARIGSTVRRLTPTECERLQGFPDGWTIPGRTVRATQRWETPSASQSSNGSAGESSTTKAA